MFTRMFGPVLLEKFCSRRDVRNHHDPFAVAVCKGTTVVGHVPGKISAAICPGIKFCEPTASHIIHTN